MKNLKGKRVIVVGLGASGVAAAKLALRSGASVVGTDAREEQALTPDVVALKQQGVRLIAGVHGKANFQGADLIVLSPGVPLFAELKYAVDRGIPLLGETEFAIQACVHGAPLLAVGGTNGKSTTTSLIGEFLKAEGLSAFVGGNLGEPFANHTETKWDVIVLEVSSFQMEHVIHFRPSVGVLLNITPDHLDRHASFEAYVLAKGNAFARQQPEDSAIYPYHDVLCKQQVQRGQAKLISFGVQSEADVQVQSDQIVDQQCAERYSRKEILLKGSHNALNIAAAIAAIGPFRVKGDTIRSVLASFSGLPHRMQFVTEVEGVRYYNDSKGTNVGAAVMALSGLEEENAILIAGGYEKKGSYEPLVQALERKGKAMVVLGQAAAAIEAAIGNRLPVVRVSTMEEAVEMSFELASPGDAVLLSPACASWDMFPNYQSRGDAFVQAVLKIRKNKRKECSFSQ
ncbi:UDP-N-acetylmuramoyl-L-alanine--D-glutamate ligase [Pajaroellobacter abortibovis]|uniref:UDP-N-acetylmuramoylalanine--D-glutamate ligase n=1 Tax=Pajaroellobacter abortibovis TaxID=1882918 RepID=A0A1L6MW32_9BACT|nr:UDP-N-acetylmuramoyl-L-alanine--D-glutamate ligase [Pajaroellobacter abortibovis]APR99684.1 UDP-N-acetylmuramoylalanine--D-glutamate ligase [Pajaroellobacter abortibovis]